MALLSGPRMPPRAGGPPRQLIVLLHGVGADGNDPDRAGAGARGEVAERGLRRPQCARTLRYGAVRPPVVLVARPAARGPAARGPGRGAFGRRVPRCRARAPSPGGPSPRAGRLLPGHHDRPLRRARRRRALAAVLGFSGALLGGERLGEEALSRPPVYLVHGDADEVVPVQAAYAAVAGLQAAEIPVQWSIRPGLLHGIDPQSIEHGAAFLAAAFAAHN